jgi:DsbC/DsbD-like thiol-disulfide interchange protein
MKYRIILSLAFAFILFNFISADAQTVTGALAERAVSRGSTVKGTIVISIPEGLHVNSNTPNSEYAIATAVRLSGVGFKPGTIEYPEGTNRKFQFSETELNVYEGEIAVPFSVVVPKTFRGKTLTVKAVVRYQACTEEVCYPPKNKEIVMTTAVK